MAKNDSGSLNARGIPSIFVTKGNLAHGIEGLSRDAGADKPPSVGEYGKPGDTDIPKAPKVPGGDNKALNKFFGRK